MHKQQTTTAIGNTIKYVLHVIM